MNFSLILCLSLFLPACIVCAIEPPKQFLRRMESEEDDFVNKMTGIISSRAKALDFEHYDDNNNNNNNNKQQFEECKGCTGEVDGHARNLRLIPKLLKRAKRAGRKFRNAANATVVVPPSSTISASDVPAIIKNSVSADTFGPLQNMTVSELFEGIAEIFAANPVLLGVGLAAALTVALPLIILESISLSTGTPILCILGASSSISFGDCRRERYLAETRTSFFDRFDTAAADEALMPNATSINATAELLSILAVPEDTLRILGNVTLGDILNDIAGGLSSNPVVFIGLVGTALIVVLPLIVLESISLATGTPILCILGAESSISFGDCRRQMVSLSDDPMCETKLLSCQMNNALIALQGLE